MRPDVKLQVGARQLASSLIILGFLFVVFYLWHKYDWNFADLKVIGFVSTLGLLFHVVRHAAGPRPSAWTLRIEAVFVALVLIFTVTRLTTQYKSHFHQAPFVDIGTTTVRASEILLKEHKNPYESHQINPRAELRKEFRGFHYGPLMLAAYAPALRWPVTGYKATSVVYVGLSLVVVWLLVWRPESRTDENVTACLFATTVFLMPERFWYEVLSQGANDIFPVALVLLALWFVRSKNLFLAGLVAALSFSAKFSPAGFLIIALLRRDLLRKDMLLSLGAGLAAGLLPIFAFLLWDRHALIDNVFKVRFLLRYDSTSLYSITPPSFQFIFPLTLWGSVLYVLAKNFKRPLSELGLLLDFTFLITVGEVTFKEIHTNHFIWFYPLYAVLFATHRHQLLTPPSGACIARPAEGEPTGQGGAVGGELSGAAP